MKQFPFDLLKFWAVPKFKDRAGGFFAGLGLNTGVMVPD
jgi:hypothetical protein